MNLSLSVLDNKKKVGGGCTHLGVVRGAIFTGHDLQDTNLIPRM